MIVIMNKSLPEAERHFGRNYKDNYKKVGDSMEKNIRNYLKFWSV